MPEFYIACSFFYKKSKQARVPTFVLLFYDDATSAKRPGCDEGTNLRLRDFAVVPLMPTRERFTTEHASQCQTYNMLFLACGYGRMFFNHSQFAFSVFTCCAYLLKTEATRWSNSLKNKKKSKGGGAVHPLENHKNIGFLGSP